MTPRSKSYAAILIVASFGALLLLYYFNRDRTHSSRMQWREVQSSIKEPDNFRSLGNECWTCIGRPTEVRRRPYLTEYEALHTAPLTDIKQIVSLAQSTITLIGSKRKFFVGEEIKVSVTLRNYYNQTRHQGGDHLRARIFNTTLEAYAPGRVIDHNNGSYTVVVSSFWPGRQTISVMLVYRREIVRSLYYMRQKVPPTRHIAKLSKSEKIQYESYCHPERKWFPLDKEMCNLTDKNNGLPWFCEKPLKPHDTVCDDWTFMKRRNPGKKPPLTREEDQLFKKKLFWETFPEIYVDVMGDFQQRKGSVSCSSYPRELLWNLQAPTGYFYKNQWHLVHCRGHDATGTMTCLQNMYLYLTGDSTTKQWYSFFVDGLGCKEILDQKIFPETGRRRICLISSINFTLEYLPHTLPVFRKGANESVINALATYMDNVQKRAKTIFVVHMFAHLLYFHPSVYRSRIRAISESARRLSQRDPTTQVLVKGPHTFVHYNYLSSGMNDFFGYPYRDIIYEEFSGLHDKVVYMDQKDMTTSKSNKDLHPSEEIVRESVYQLFSYICV